MIDVENATFSWAPRTAAAPGTGVLDIASFHLDAGETAFLHGPSGCGKSTFLGLVAGVLQAQGGTVRVDGTDLGSLSAPARDRFRADRMGVIFQMFNLLPYLSVLDNVLLAVRFSERRHAALGAQAKDEALRLLAHLRMDAPELLAAPVARLSVGQQQRVAAARALLGRPPVVLADEPTSALDEEVKAEFIDLLLAECAEAGSTLLFVSHDPRLAGRFDRAVEFRDLAAGRAAA
ncbi:putative ABC transporter ATP-binding protein/MT1014 [Pseudoruegeria aquimaris]|uniref:Putative ABC transporter ATP-binding protein/MT1014 n=1 Tax=Pseudoruegeria aquimaris TaxID=393663 RepID=A0A1Y5RFU2_9RHOB|nr:ABC transporter ATP-binding protein [Pseudoruegeria aquimaris]SLN16519.1 putative ABC transporter ATP-binding protein/MT1014 [Pseudoruegeria aquimaris]